MLALLAFEEVEVIRTFGAAKDDPLLPDSVK
jgi:hypothetical protein